MTSLTHARTPVAGLPGPADLTSLLCPHQDRGSTWGDQHVITDPDSPPDVDSNEQHHLGAMRHGVLPWPDGRWLLPLRDPKPNPDSAWGPRLWDPGEPATPFSAKLKRLFAFGFEETR